MGSEKHYMLVNPSGDICLVCRFTGSPPATPFPIQMRDEWGRLLPYTEQGTVNHGCVPGYFSHATELFTPIMISPEQFTEIGHPVFYLYRYDRKTRRIQLRPGHCKTIIPPGMWGNPNKEYYKLHVQWSDDLELCNIAYGGRPIYWIKWDSEKFHTDFPELATQGCLHPLKYKPREALAVAHQPQSFPSQWLLRQAKKLSQ